MKLEKNYLLATFLILIVEVIIAKCIHDDFIRPYFGDFLVVILLYCMLKTFIKIRITYAVFLVLCFSYCIEALQYFKILIILGLEKSRFWSIIIGNSFSWCDMLAYTLGLISVCAFEKYINKKPL